MNRKELGFAALGTLLGAAGCSDAGRALLVPEAAVKQPETVPFGIDMLQADLDLWVPRVGTPKISAIQFNGKPGEWTISSSHPHIVAASFFPYVTTQAIQLKPLSAPGQARITVTHKTNFTSIRIYVNTLVVPHC